MLNFTSPDPVPPQLIPHQSLGDIPSSGQRFEMSAVVDQLHLLQVQSLQNLLTGPVHDLQLFMAVYQDQRTTVNPLQRREENKWSKQIETFLFIQGKVCIFVQNETS